MLPFAVCPMINVNAINTNAMIKYNRNTTQVGPNLFGLVEGTTVTVSCDFNRSDSVPNPITKKW